MLGLGTTISSGASGAETTLRIVDLLTDREALVAQLRELAKGMERIQAAREQLGEVEAELLRREQKVVADEAANAKRSADLDEREVRVQAMQQRAEQGIAELAALKADLKSRMAA
jgi:hypothetical protein